MTVNGAGVCSVRRSTLRGWTVAMFVTERTGLWSEALECLFAAGKKRC